ncbi:MAG: SOS response-associated peptidase [Phycisphaerae bacterium]
MCGRYTLTCPAEMVARLFDLGQLPPLGPPRYNIAPSQPVPAVRADQDGARQLTLFQWGLVPFWAKDPAIGNRMINARAETAAEKPAYRAAYKYRRCLLPADGFYEWKKLPSGGKQPVRIRRRDHKPFALAGLWESWDQGGLGPLETCTILTIEPNDLLRGIHNRMPVILPPESFGMWLDPGLQDSRARQPVAGLLTPWDPEPFEAYPVSRVVNSPANDSPECIEPIEAE